METKNPIYDKDKATVLSWLQHHCYGYKNAVTRDKILPNMQFLKEFEKPEHKDRYFRKIFSHFKHQGHTASTNSRGYWFIPVVTTDKREIEAALESVSEMKSKALNMLQDSTKLENKFQDKLVVITQGQQELVL